VKLDALTGLATHHAVAQRLGDTVSFGVLFDVDALAWATSVFGPAHSDRMLVRVAEAVGTAARRDGGEAFRIGGDEFLAWLPDASHDDALQFARRVIREVAALQLEYARPDDPSRRFVSLNAVVCQITAGLSADIERTRQWAAQMIWRAKQANGPHLEVVADAGDAVPPWSVVPGTT
jgi:diguanylate cyclase (GGDEF)-like protein